MKENISGRRHCEYVEGGAVGEAGVSPPSDPLVGWELAGPLALEEEDGLSEGVSVVVVDGAAVAGVAEWGGIAAKKSGGEEEEEE